MATMTMTVREIREERAKLITQARELYNKAKAENRSTLNTEEKSQFDKMMSEVGSLDDQIKLRDAEDSLYVTDERRSSPPGTSGHGRRGGDPRLGTQEYRDVFENYVRGQIPTSHLESRGLVLGADSGGGYLALPVDLQQLITTVIDDMSGLYRDATKINVRGAVKVGLPHVSARGDDADWGAEVPTTTADASLAFGRKDLTPALCTKLVKASRTSAARIDNFSEIVIQQLGRMFGVTWEKALLTGSGSGQPRGIFTAHADGIPTSRDVSTGNTQTEVTYEGLLRAKYSVKQAYLMRDTTKWIANPAFMVNVLLLTDNNNRPIFVPGAQGREDTLLGLPISYSEFAPNTWTTGSYVAALGDASTLCVAIGNGYGVQVVQELYAVSNELGFFGRVEGDANVAVPEAWARVKLA